MKTNDKDVITPYIVMATAFGHKDQQISAPMDKENADALVDRLKASMEDIDKDFKVFDNIKAVKYKAESLNPNEDKKDPYNYSVLDALDKKISKEATK